jgi:hypothetical protein
MYSGFALLAIDFSGFSLTKPTSNWTGSKNSYSECVSSDGAQHLRLVINFVGIDGKSTVSVWCMGGKWSSIAWVRMALAEEHENRELKSALAVYCQCMQLMGIVEMTQ